jgi:hypothetical protein
MFSEITANIFEFFILLLKKVVKTQQFDSSEQHSNQNYHFF